MCSAFSGNNFIPRYDEYGTCLNKDSPHYNQKVHEESKFDCYVD